METCSEQVALNSNDVGNQATTREVQGNSLDNKELSQEIRRACDGSFNEVADHTPKYILWHETK